MWSRWTLTIISCGIKKLAFRTKFYTLNSVPEMIFSTFNTKIFSGRERTRRTNISASIFVNIWKSWAFRAFWTNKENVLEGEILNHFLISHIEVKFASCPFSLKGKSLIIVVQDEASDPENSSIISSDILKRGMSDTSTHRKLIWIITINYG